MKKVLAIIILVFSALATVAQPGKYAGKHKGLIKTVFTDSRKITALSGWSAIQASILNPLTDPVRVAVDIFKKGSTFVVFFSTSEVSVTEEFTIADVIEIKPVAKGWIIQTSLCQQNGVEDPLIFAWIKQTPTEYLKVLKKAWRFNAEKKEIEIISSKGITCLNEGFDLTFLSH